MGPQLSAPCQIRHVHVIQRCLVSAEIRSSDPAPIAGSSASSVHLLDDREFPSLTVGQQGGIKSAPRRSLDIDVSPLAPVLEAELLRADSIEARILDGSEAGAVHSSRLASAAFCALHCRSLACLMLDCTGTGPSCCVWLNIVSDQAMAPTPMHSKKQAEHELAQGCSTQCPGLQDCTSRSRAPVRHAQQPLSSTILDAVPDSKQACMLMLSRGCRRSEASSQAATPEHPPRCPCCCCCCCRSQTGCSTGAPGCSHQSPTQPHHTLSTSFGELAQPHQP